MRTILGSFITASIIATAVAVPVVLTHSGPAQTVGGSPTLSPVPSAKPSSNEFTAKNPNKAVDGLDVGVNDGTADGTGEEVGVPTTVCAEPD